MQAQNSDLERIQAMDAKLDDKIAADMDKILNRPSHVGYTSSVKASSTREMATTPPRESVPIFDSDEDDPNFGDIYAKDLTPSPSRRRGSATKHVQNPLASPAPSLILDASKAPETADRSNFVNWRAELIKY